jgi:hypothetical protein
MTTTGQLFNPTKRNLLWLQILEHLSRFEVLTSRDLSFLIFGDEKHSHITMINRALDVLDVRYHFVNRIFFRPENYLGRGNLPNASGLSANGVIEAAERWPATYPKEFPPTHSPHTIEHDLRRARTHIKVHAFAQDQGWKLGWKKGDNRIVKPDDIFEITATKTAHFFLEEEHKRKDFKDLYAKLKPYVDLHGTNKMKEEWGFRYFTVIVPMRDAEAMANLITHLRGLCDCVDRKLKQMHSGSPFKLVTNVLAFTTHEDIIEHTAGPILHATTGKTLSFLDIIQ